MFKDVYYIHAFNIIKKRNNKYIIHNRNRAKIKTKNNIIFHLNKNKNKKYFLLNRRKEIEVKIEGCLNREYF